MSRCRWRIRRGKKVVFVKIFCKLVIAPELLPSNSVQVNNSEATTE